MPLWEWDNNNNPCIILFLASLSLSLPLLGRGGVLESLSFRVPFGSRQISRRKKVLRGSCSWTSSSTWGRATSRRSYSISTDSKSSEGRTRHSEIHRFAMERPTGSSSSSLMFPIFFFIPIYSYPVSLCEWFVRMNTQLLSIMCLFREQQSPCSPQVGTVHLTQLIGQH